MRIEIIADRRLRTREAICAALKEYGYALLDVQRDALERHCWNVMQATRRSG